MESLLLRSLPLPQSAALPHCEPQNALLGFVSSQLQTCVPTTAALLSTTAGLLSITAWLFAQLPQIVKNYRLQSSESLSFLFILIWCLGDSSNFFGAVLLNQMTFQKVIAFYYVLVDVVLVAQWRWYNRPAALQDARRQSASGRDKESRSTTSHPAASVDASPRTTPPRPSNVFMTLALLFNLVRAAPIASSSSAVTTLLDDASLRTLGMLLGWSSTILYLSSRLPQIYLNHKRRSVAGLSPLLFAAAFCGNFFYSSSLLLNPQAWSDLPAYGEHGWVGPEGSSAAAWWTDTLPFLLGSAGVLSMDGYIGLQFWKWGGQEEPEGEQEDAREVIVGVDAYDSDDDHRIRQGTGKAVEVNTKERSYFDEQTALLARMNGVYGTSAESSRSAELRR